MEYQNLSKIKNISALDRRNFVGSRHTEVIPVKFGFVSTFQGWSDRSRGLYRLEALVEIHRGLIGNGNATTKEQHVEILLAKDDSLDTP